MRVCIIRNAEARTNAGMMRIVDALSHGGYIHCLLSRSRYVNPVDKKVIRKDIMYKGNNVANYEIQLPGETGKGISNIFQLFRYQIIVFKWLISNRMNYDAIHAFDLDAGFPSIISSIFTRKPIVYHIADFYVDSRPGIPKQIKKIVRRLECLVISRAEVTIICTEERAEQIKGSNPKKLIVIHNSPSENHEVNKSKVKSENLFSDSNSLVLCYVGGLEERRFIKSVINVISENKDYELKIAGMGNLENLVKQSTQETTNIEYCGRVDYSEALKMYASCDIMFAIYDPTVPNHYYSAPNKVYEAMMLGKPIIVAKGTGVDKLVEKEGIGICIDYSERDLQIALDYIRQNPKEIKEMGDRAKKVFELYSWDRMKKRLIDSYEEIKKNS